MARRLRWWHSCAHLRRMGAVKHKMLKSTAVSDAGLTKQTLYEVGKDSFTPRTYERANKSLYSVNGEIVGLIPEHGDERGSCPLTRNASFLSCFNILVDIRGAGV